MTPDVFFVSSYEPDAEANWQRLHGVAPRARHITGLPSIHAAYAACADAARTSHFFMVDGDNWVVDGFVFDLDFAPRPEEVVVWGARNPVNGLVYGHGGIKLLPGAMTGEAAQRGAIDMATTIAPAYRRVDVLASEHRFNTSPFDTWRTAFRECAKLAAHAIRNRCPARMEEGLGIWCADVPDEPAAAYAGWCVTGAREGRAYGARHAGQIPELARINDFAWLRQVWAKKGKRVLF